MRFGVSGNLRNSDLIMWDDLTETWWQQLTGEGIVGDLAGYFLDPLPSQLIGYGEFKASFPNAAVLGRDTGLPPRLRPQSLSRLRRGQPAARSCSVGTWTTGCGRGSGWWPSSSAARPWPTPLPTCRT